MSRLAYLFPLAILLASLGGIFLSFSPVDIFSVQSVGGFSNPLENPYPYVSISFYLASFSVFATAL
jgi:hypothetical protein